MMKYFYLFSFVVLVGLLFGSYEIYQTNKDIDWYFKQYYHYCTNFNSNNLPPTCLKMELEKCNSPYNYCDDFEKFYGE